MAWLQQGLKVLHFVFCFSLTIWGGREGRRSGKEGKRNALFPHFFLPCLPHGQAQAVFSPALSSAPGVPCMMSQGMEVICLCTASNIPPSPPFYVLPWFSLSCLLSTTALLYTCHAPAPPWAEHWGTGDDAGEGSALQALIL